MRFTLNNNQIYVKKISIFNKKKGIDKINNDILMIKDKMIYIPTVDSKIMCIEKWHLKKKTKKKLKLRILWK